MMAQGLNGLSTKAWTVLVAGVFVVGCSQTGSDGSESATAGQDGTGGTSAAPVEITDGEWIRLVGECLIDRGYNVTINEDEASLESNIGEDPGAVEQYTQASETCEQSLIEQGRLPATGFADEEQAAAEYRRLRLMADCITQEGYAVPEAPSIDVFVETNGLGWHPYMGLGNLSETDFTAINTSCPQDMGR